MITINHSSISQITMISTKTPSAIFRELSTFDNDDQETVVKVIDAMIIKHRVEHAMQITPTTKKAS